MVQVEVHPKVLVLPSTPSGRILATPAQVTLHFLLQFPWENIKLSGILTLPSSRRPLADIHNSGFTQLLHSWGCNHGRQPHFSMEVCFLFVPNLCIMILIIWGGSGAVTVTIESCYLFFFLKEASWRQQRATASAPTRRPGGYFYCRALERQQHLHFHGTRWRSWHYLVDSCSDLARPRPAATMSAGWQSQTRWARFLETRRGLLLILWDRYLIFWGRPLILVGWSPLVSGWPIPWPKPTCLLATYDTHC